MSLFDNDIINKDPEELIWVWLENHYIGRTSILKEVLEIDKKNYINVKKSYPLKCMGLDENEILPSYIKFRNNDITRRCIKFTGCDINESYKDLLFYHYIGNAQDVTIKSYDILILEGHFENITVKFCAKKTWELSVDDLKELSKITVESNQRSVGCVVCNYSYDLSKNMRDLKDIQRIVKDFFSRHPRCKKILVENDNNHYQYIVFKTYDGQIEMNIHDERI